MTWVLVRKLLRDVRVAWIVVGVTFPVAAYDGPVKKEVFTMATYTAVNGKAVITSPDPLSPFAGASMTFTWTAGAGATAYSLEVGTSVGGSEIFSQNMGLARTQTVSVQVGWIFVRLWTQLAGRWQFDDYVYSRSDLFQSRAQIYAPRPANVLGPSVQFLWTSIPSAVEYSLQVGTAPGLGDLCANVKGVSRIEFTVGLGRDTRPSNKA